MRRPLGYVLAGLGRSQARQAGRTGASTCSVLISDGGMMESFDGIQQ